MDEEVTIRKKTNKTNIQSFNSCMCFGTFNLFIYAICNKHHWGTLENHCEDIIVIGFYETWNMQLRKRRRWSNLFLSS
jgi:hypothetical protein